MREAALTPLLLAAGLLAGCADVEEPARIVPAFAELDTDGDGYLSRSEAERVPELAEALEIADQNADGRLSVAEFSRVTVEGTRVSAEAARGPQFDALDLDGDGVIGPAEADAVPALARDFERFDRDGDGRLDLQEYHAAAEAGLSPE